MKKRYFFVNLKTGEQIMFFGRCNNVDNNGSDYIFKHVEDDKKTWTCLGIIPRENISSVLLTIDEN